MSQITVDDGGVNVRVSVFVPPAFDGEPLPAVLDWHGLGSDGVQQQLLTGYRDLARSEGFVAVHPTGVPLIAGQGNAWELAQFDAPDRDDVAMAAGLIDRLVTEFCVDPDRVYSTGMSNGGFFTALLVCELADRLAAAVSVGGVSHPEGCTPSRPVPFAAFHGTADGVVPFDGGSSSLDSGTGPAELRAFFDQVMPDEFAEFAADFGCSPAPERTAVSSEVIRYRFPSCDDEVELEFYEIVGGGHTWPGSPLGPLLSLALGVTTDDVDATVDGWAFMRRFSRSG